MYTVPFSTLFGVYTPQPCRIRHCIFFLKENGSEYSLLEKIYNALFYTVVEYIHQLYMLSHVKYKNSIFNRIKKNLNII